MSYCFFNGKILPEDKAAVSLYDLGLLRGYAVFDFMRTYNGRPFLFKEHLERLRQSAAALNLSVPLSDGQIEEEIKKLLAKNGLKEANIKIVLTGGDNPDGLTSLAGGGSFPNPPTFFILVKERASFPADIRQKGVKLITAIHRRNISRAKTTDYITAVKLQKQKDQAKAAEILYIWRDKVREGSNSNFFIFRDDILITPRDGVLFGVTRDFVINLAKEKFKVEERPVMLEEIRQADEAFITSTSREIWPVVQINDIKIGDGRVGKNTKDLMEMFREFVKNYKIQR